MEKCSNLLALPDCWLENMSLYSGVTLVLSVACYAIQLLSSIYLVLIQAIRCA
jgi:hypothetical protein